MVDKALNLICHRARDKNEDLRSKASSHPLDISENKDTASQSDSPNVSPYLFSLAVYSTVVRCIIVIGFYIR